MGSEKELECRSHELARRFLQTAVVVDDEAYMETNWSGEPRGKKLVSPGRHTQVSNDEDQSEVVRELAHSLDARSVIDSFSALGVICGVIEPTKSAMEVMRQADIVVLDWLLKDGSSKLALELLRNLVTKDADKNSLRLVAIYTGEARLKDISKDVFNELFEAGLDPKNKPGMVVSYQHGSVVLYAKSGVSLEKSLKERSITEKDLPLHLVEDFSAMTEGLLPGIALTSLTAVREGAHMVLDQFSADLDPAFLTHRACITNPDDAERQIVDHVAEDLRGLMDSAVAEQSPASAQAVESWIRRKDQGAEFTFDDQSLSLEETIKLATEGLKKSDKLSDKYFEHLTAGFADGDAVDLDERLAWIMSFRTVFNEPPPTLWLGSVVTATMDGNETHLICMRPRCDCVRLKVETSFFFLPLVEPTHIMEQFVVKFDDKFKRLGIRFDPGGWIHRQFKPSKDDQAIIATKREPNGTFEFEDTCAGRYTWRGELKTEYAQRIAQAFATKLSRVAIDESEWLRRMARKGQ